VPALFWLLVVFGPPVFPSLCSMLWLILAKEVF
jgi:hypothetical protein